MCPPSFTHFTCELKLVGDFRRLSVSHTSPFTSLKGAFHEFFEQVLLQQQSSNTQHRSSETFSVSEMRPQLALFAALGSVSVHMVAGQDASATAAIEQTLSAVLPDCAVCHATLAPPTLLRTPTLTLTTCLR